MTHAEHELNAESLNVLKELMKASTSVDSKVQEQIHQRLEEFKTQPDFPKYLAYLFSTADDITVRAISGITLKNIVKRPQVSFTPQVYHQIRESTLQCLSDPNPTVRGVAGTIMTTILSYDFHAWPGAVEVLLGLIDGNNQYAADGAFGALYKICEDSASVLEANDANLAMNVIAKFMFLLGNSDQRIRSESVATLNNFLLARSRHLVPNIQPFLDSILVLVNDESTKVKKEVCQTLLLISEISSGELAPRINLVIDFMCHCLDSEDEDLAMEACEFWLSFVEHPDFHDHLESCLPRLVPLLVKRMIYSDEYIANYETLDDDGDEEDQDKDIEPRHHKAKLHKTITTSQSKQKGEAGLSFIDDYDQHSDEGAYQDDDDDDMFSEWDIRKCASTTVDTLSTIFGRHLLVYLRPLIMHELHHPSWIHKECGVLILGVVAEGCATAVSDDLPKLLPFLLSMLNHPHPLVRTITCWTISKCIFWTTFPIEMLFNQSSGPAVEELSTHRKTYFEPSIYGILDLMLDNNKRVQRSACSAFITMVGVAQDVLIPYLGQIAYTLEGAFKKYKRRNLRILYDALGALCDSVGGALGEQKYVDSLMGMLYLNWQTIDDLDKNMSPLLECMSSVALAIGPSFQPFAKEVWVRNNGILDKLFKVAEENETEHNADVPYKDYIAVSLDLMGSICQALGPSVSDLIESSSKPIIYYIQTSLADTSSNVRQSAFALVGDLAASAYLCVKPHLNIIMERVVMQVRDSPPLQTSTTNNAIWAVGEIALKSQKEEFGPWIEVLSGLFISTLNSNKSDDMLRGNAAVSLGRMCLIYPSEMSGFLPYFFSAWCDNFAGVSDFYEKKTAFEGLYNVIKLNPMGAADNLSKLCEAVVAWNTMPNELVEMFREILLTYKNGWGEQWNQIVSQWPPNLTQKLSEKCEI